MLRAYLTPGAGPLATPGNLLLFMLGPATLSFGFQMFGRRRLMRQSAKAVTAVTAVAASSGLFATAVAGRASRRRCEDHLRRPCRPRRAVSVSRPSRAEPNHRGPYRRSKRRPSASLPRRHSES